MVPSGDINPAANIKGPETRMTYKLLGGTQLKMSKLT